MSGVKGQQKKCPAPEPQCQDPCAPAPQVIEQKCPSPPPQACVPEPVVCPQPQVYVPEPVVCPQPQACVPEPVVCPPKPQDVCSQSPQKTNVGVKK